MSEFLNACNNFVKQLLVVSSEEQIEKLMQENEGLLYPPLYEVILQLQQDPANAKDARLLEGIGKILLPEISRNTLWYWLNIKDEQEKQELAEEFLIYLVNEHVAGMWKKLEEDEAYSHHQVKNSKLLLQQEATKLLFNISDIDRINDYIEVFERLYLETDWAKTPYFRLEARNRVHARIFMLLGSILGKTAFNSPCKLDDIQVIFYEKALAFYHKQNDIKEKGLVLNDLSIAYRKRVVGQQEKNIEKAIELAREALQTVQKSESPREWLMFQNTLGNAYNQNDSSENIENSIKIFSEIISIATFDKMPLQWGMAQNNLGISYRKRVVGDRAENMEKAIMHYENAMLVRTRKDMPWEWGRTQFNLGLAYIKRVEGDKFENYTKALLAFNNALLETPSNENPYDWANIQLNMGDLYMEEDPKTNFQDIESAIRSYENALKVYTFNKDQDEWINVQKKMGEAYFRKNYGEKADNIEKSIKIYQNILDLCGDKLIAYDKANILYHLGVDYIERVSGNSFDNIEKAIDLLNQSLEIFTRERYPRAWGKAQGEIGLCYANRNKGNRSDNIEQAIRHLFAALEIYTKEEDPSAWANYCGNLGPIHFNRIKGDRAGNLEKAIEFYGKALSVFTREQYPRDWAMIQSNLGNSYIERLLGKREDNIESAIEAFENALLVRKRSEQPYQWAFTKTNLANAYLQRIAGNKSDNIEKAISIIEDGLLVRTEEKLPLEWAISHTALGTAYALRIAGNESENREKAIRSYLFALSKYSPEKDPLQWASIQTNLGLVYGRGNEPADIDKAIHFLESALKIRQPNLLPEACLETARKLSVLYYGRKNYPAAIATLEICHQAMENMRFEALNSFSKERLIAENDDLYRILVDCCLAQNDFSKAFEYVCISKGRSLAEKLGTHKPDINKLAADNAELAVQWKDLQITWQKIEELQQKIVSAFRPDHGNNAVEDLINVAQKENLLRLKELHALRNRKKEEFVFRFPMVASTLNLSKITVDVVKELAGNLRSTLIEYYFHGSGLAAFIVTATDLDYVNLSVESFEAINAAVEWNFSLDSNLSAFYGTIRQKRIFRNLYSSLIEPLKPYLSKNNSLLIAPHRNMHYIPFSLAINQNDQYFSEEFNLSFMTSITSAYALFQQQLKEPVANAGSKIENVFVTVHTGRGGNKLTYTLEEVEMVKSCFNNYVMLYEDAATPKAVIETAGSKPYNTLHFSCHGSFDYSQPYLSGLFINGTLTVEQILNELRLQQRPLVVLSACQTGRSRVEKGDELNGLNQALLQAGAGTIVSSLWSVSDKATMYLFKYFYEERNKNGAGDYLALRKAMQKVRSLPGYESPFFWGAFQLYGLPFVT